MSLNDVFGQTNVIGGTVPTLITPAGGSNRDILQIANVGAATVYIGGAAVTIATGFPLLAGGNPFMVTGPGAVYGIVASGTIDVRTYYSA